MHVDIVAQGFDAGIRNRRWIHQDMVTVPLTGPFKSILVASGNYLAARGAPKSIADGISYVPEPLARPYLSQGSLNWLLPQTAVEFGGLFLYYPRRASLAPKLRAFIDVAKKTLKSFE
jgi:DNA-binding transcriptional LysR family regulator